MKTHRTWIVVADGKRAKIVRFGKERRLFLENAFPFEWINAELCAIGAAPEAPGSAGADTIGGRRYRMPARSEPHREAKRHFAEELAGLLSQEREDQQYDHLVLIAAPTTLGDLRAALGPAVANCIVATSNKDLTKASDKELTTHVKELLRDAVAV